MNDFTTSECYRRCQAMFDRWYPGFRNAGQMYQDIITALAKPYTTLLDIGCGRMSLASDPMRAMRYTIGIDLDLRDLKNNHSISFPVGAEGGALPFAARSFDLVLGQWVIEHLPVPQRLFQEMARVLRTDGRIVLFTTNANNYIPWLSRVLTPGWQQRLVKRFLHRLNCETFPVFYRANTPKKLGQLARAAGLALESCVFVGSPFYLAFSPTLFRMALLFEKLTDHHALRQFKLYLLATLRQAQPQESASKTKLF